MIRLARAVDAQNVAIAGLDTLHVPGPAGPLQLRMYTPQRAREGLTPTLIYFHGGAGVFGNLDTHDGLCRILSNASACRVLSVDYRLAPENPFPAAVEDSYVATQWISTHAEELGIDASRIAVAGDSHGGTLAAVVCQRARDCGNPRIAAQLLICPVLDLAAQTGSRKRLATGYFLDASLLDWAVSQYCPRDADLHDPRLSPLRAHRLSGLPPAYVHTAEFDPMRDEGEAYARALEQAGVEVHYVCHPGMIHHFYAMAGAIPYARSALDSAGKALGEALGHPGRPRSEDQRGAKNSI
jgi:acetyl esterase